MHEFTKPGVYVTDSFNVAEYLQGPCVLNDYESLHTCFLQDGQRQPLAALYPCNLRAGSDMCRPQQHSIELDVECKFITEFVCILFCRPRLRSLSQAARSRQPNYFCAWRRSRDQKYWTQFTK